MLAVASAWRARGWPRLLPVNVTVSTNFRCNFRCATCNVYERRVRELDAGEWARVFASLGRAPVWMTFSGGEPFLRRDLPDVVLAAVDACQPAVVNIPSNGWFTDRVVDGVARICRASPGTQLVVNLSLDHAVPDRHDAIRGAPGSWDRLMATLDGLRALALPNLTVGCHTVVSTENEADFPAVAEGLAALGADSYIVEPAEQRVELGTVDAPIAPTAARFAGAAAASLAADRVAAGGVARLVRALRGEYYDRVTRFLAGDAAAMPVCHAGFLSTHIGADGDVWSCCVLARSFGNVRDTGLDFRRVWFSDRAEEFRRWMRARRCACPLANAAYTNLLVEPAAVGRVAVNLARPPRSPAITVPAGAGAAPDPAAAGHEDG
jgi:MoaA/NifB/PqqE/SkfB family radical SAM enzyme